MTKSVKYRKKFAFLPVYTKFGERIWFRIFYKKYEIIQDMYTDEDGFLHHVDFIENITESDYLVLKLADNLYS